MGATEDKTRPISFRVDVGVLDALTRAGLSTTEIAHAALAKEARRARAVAALEDLAANPATIGLGEDVVEFLRRDRRNPPGHAAALDASQQCFYLRALEIVSVAQPTVETFLRALSVASSRGLSFYDAAYVALADDRRALLWTEDRVILKQCSDLAIDSTALTARARGR